MIPHESTYQVSPALLAGLGASVVLWAALWAVLTVHPRLEPVAVESFTNLPSECAVYACGAGGGMR